MKSLNEAFDYLWYHGHRMISKEDKDSMNNGLYKNEDGMVTGYTINGLKTLASKGKLSIAGLKISPEEVERMFNYGKFIRQMKS